ncbi:unnamed protein product [Penicillium salamii]|uniref:BZIP domain-containing protein n=1 Tax=Penicillium salamii TaxID=1612424 RepID=A0A9W4J309_9EURO|nr:unnamed protein product [Penicillium salamii]CAG8370249.1 unnamed protein product [Penicillium salamii]CAG8371964.1 unnamed protein product [Penicillium salamii]CAG8376892.1 unnamed protein product [Penicillium salamii]
MLSSRSYLDLSHERPHTQKDKKLSPEPHQSERPRTPKHLPSRAPNTPDQVSGIFDNSSAAPDRPARKRGRPKLETIKDAAAIEERRLQIRRAQRTYRNKKEATIQALRSRVNSLEQTLANVSDLLAHDAGSGAPPSADYLARTRELILAELGRATPTDHDAPIQNADQRDIFGYHVSHASGTEPQNNTRTISRIRPRSPSPLINRILPTATIYTYSHQESNLSRRLQRFCLEHTYRWLTDPNTPPAQLSRVFGLVPCIHDMPGIRRHFRRTLQSEIGSNLEYVKMPYYTLGGAGTHFPQLRDGRPVFPENTRRPGRILRRMERILERGGIRDWDEDWSGDSYPVGLGLGTGDEERIRSLDLDGEWFDCHDVQGYLEHRGVALDGALRLGVPEALVGALYGVSPMSSVSSLYASPGVFLDQVDPREAYTLDVECFFDRGSFPLRLLMFTALTLTVLLPNLRILGRAPGFRTADVDAALRGAISRRSFA